MRQPSASHYDHSNFRSIEVVSKFLTICGNISTGYCTKFINWVRLIKIALIVATNNVFFSTFFITWLLLHQLTLFRFAWLHPLFINMPGIFYAIQ